MSEDQQRNKSHKARNSGRKQVKKEMTDKKKRGLDLQPNRGNNPKAFIGHTTGSRKAKMEAKSLERKEVQLHMPTADRTLSNLVRDPPLLVAVVGPPGSGKTTLIRSMVKFYSHKSVRDLRGPVTVVAGRYRRLTFMECPNDTASMCDLAKIADLVIMVIDGNFGFEMETFEFITIAQIHGFPRVIGVISHLDKLKTTKQLNRTKRIMRHRFWHEVSTGAKMLSLAPLLHGTYRSGDVLKLHRLLISADMKVQAWRNTHSCVFIDRHEDITNPDAVAREPDMDRTVACYGYVRGHPVRPNQRMHIPGVGDFQIKHISIQEDPCIPLEKGAATKAARMRHMSSKHRKMYAPYCDANALGFDETAVFVHEDTDRANIVRTGEGLEKLRELQTAAPIDERLRANDLEIVTGSGVVRRPVNFDKAPKDVKVDDDEASSEWSDEDVNDPMKRDFGHLDDLLGGADGGDDDDNADGGNDGLRPRPPNAKDATRIHAITGPNWHDEPYRTALKTLFVTGGYANGGAAATAGEDGAANDEELPAAADDDDAESYGSKGYESLDSADEGGDASEDRREKVQSVLRQSRTAEKISTKAGKKTGQKDVKRPAEMEDEDEPSGVGVDDDVQDLLDHFLSRKLGASTGSGAIQSFKDDEALLRQQGGAETAVEDDEDDGGDTAFGSKKRSSGPGALAGLKHTKGMAGASDKADAAEKADDANAYLKKKLAKKQEFDAGYDVDRGKNNSTGFYHHLMEQEAEKKQRLDKTLELVGEDLEKRVALAGYFSGLYVRIVFERVPVEFTKRFDPRRPLFAGGINAGEDEKAIVYARIKNHRWYPRILKAQDPMVISVGWRRLQVQPCFAAEDPNGRHRYLKYTPRHMHCMAAFYSYVVPPNTGFVVLPGIDQTVKSFRIPGSGYTIASDHSSSIVKKLKLTGVPETIQKTTVFIKGMFTSDIEAAKFVGAKVKSVSGLRGIIKKAIKSKDGIVRCTFEDKLLKSDIVFLRAWTPVEPPRYCVDVLNALAEGGRWQGMRPMSQLRKAFGVPLKHNPDSEYKEIERRPDRPGDDKVLVSRTMRLALPFEMKEQFIPINRSSELEERVRQSATIAPEPREQLKLGLLNTFRQKAAEMDSKRKAAKAIKREKTKREQDKDEEENERRLKKARKETARKVEFRSQHKSRRGKDEGVMRSASSGSKK